MFGFVCGRRKQTWKMHQNMLISGLANNCIGIEPMKKRIYKKPEIKKCGKLENAAQKEVKIISVNK